MGKREDAIALVQCVLVAVVTILVLAMCTIGLNIKSMAGKLEMIENDLRHLEIRMELKTDKIERGCNYRNNRCLDVHEYIKKRLK